MIRDSARLCAIVSATNRRGVAAISKSLRRTLGERAELDIRVVASTDAATAEARQAASYADIVIAVGGDGAVADVATGIFNTPAALGIVPAGSTNITARSLGIPRDPAAAIAVLAGPHSRLTIDIGRCADRSFLHIAGAGFDAELFKAANPAWKRRLGWIAYLPAAVAALRVRPSRVYLTIDGERIEAISPLVLVANGGAAISPEFNIYPGISVSDGWLDVLLFTATTAKQIAATLGYAGRQRLDLSPDVVWRRAHNVRIEADPSLSIQLDGDPRGATPQEFVVVAGALNVVVPRERAREAAQPPR